MPQILVALPASNTHGIILLQVVCTSHFLWMRYFEKALLQIWYNWPLGLKDKLITFWWSKVKVTVTSQCPIHSLWKFSNDKAVSQRWWLQCNSAFVCDEMKQKHDIRPKATAISVSPMGLSKESCTIVSGERQIHFRSHLNCDMNYTYDVRQFRSSQVKNVAACHKDSKIQDRPHKVLVMDFVEWQSRQRHLHNCWVHF